MVHLTLHLSAARLMTSCRGSQNHSAGIQIIDADINRSVQNQRTVLRILQLLPQDPLYILKLLFIPDLEVAVYNRGSHGHMDDIAHFIVRDNLDIIHIHVEQLGHPDSHLHDIPSEIADPDDIPDLNISLHQQENAGQDIADQAVRSDTENHRHDSRRRHQGCRIQPKADHAPVKQVRNRQIGHQASKHLQDRASPDRKNIAHRLDEL